MSSNFTEFVSSDRFSVETLDFSAYIISSASSDSFTSYFVICVPFGASLVAQLVKNLLQCRRPGFDPRVGKIPYRWIVAACSSILARRIPWSEEPGGLQSIESQRVRHDLATEQ